jgi:diguanylate cyclase (GGDEF)-like protein
VKSESTRKGFILVLRGLTRLSCSGIICALFLLSQAVATTYNQADISSEEISNSIKIIPDPENNIDPVTAFSDTHAKPFAFDPILLSSGTKSWLVKIDFPNFAGLNQNIVLITVDQGWDKVEVINAQRQTVAITGSKIPIDDRTIQISSLVLPIYKPNELDYFLRFSSKFDDYDNPTEFITNIQSRDNFVADARKRDIFNSIYIGVTFGIIVFHFLIWLTLKDKLYLLYVLHVSSFSMIWIHKSGILSTWLFPDAVSWNYYGSFFLVGFAILFGNLFVEYFLRLKRNLPFISKILIFTDIAVLICFVTGLAYYWDFAKQLLAFISLALVIFYLYAGVKCWKDGFKPAKYFSLAYAILLVSIFAYTLNFFGFFPRLNILLHQSPQIASVLSAILLAFAVVDQIKRIETHKKELSIRIRSDLQREVELRTAEIERQRLITEKLLQESEKMNKELVSVNLKLEQLNFQDPLTEIGNRRLFDRMLEKLWENWKINKKSFAIILVDIDHFKKVNDIYGHLVGDQVLKVVASRLSQFSKAGFSARYGGEEFAILLSGETMDSLSEIAEEICLCISQIPIKLEDAPIRQLSLTVSIGAAMIETDDQSKEELLERSDAALYEAKNNGRNCFVIKGRMKSKKTTS